MPESKLQYFKEPVTKYSLPKKFTFPFYYEPHVLCLLAVNELQEYLGNQNEWSHNFGLSSNHDGLVIGKMFGVLVVETPKGQLGYLAAFSGKLADENHHRIFVPPVFDMLTKDSFFRQEEIELNELNDKVEALENDVDFIALLDLLESRCAVALQELVVHKKKLRIEKRKRKLLREKAIIKLEPLEYGLLLKELEKKSLLEKYYHRELENYWSFQLRRLERRKKIFSKKIDRLKKIRKERSAKLQQKLFEQYQFLNQQGKRKNLIEIFLKTSQKKPPAAAGECAAPKLLQYAFSQNLKPIAMAEFWWGKSPSKEVRKHKQFYPSCQSKCKPILQHMLNCIEMDENPMLVNNAIGKEVKIIYQDAAIAVINKPEEFLSVPGVHIQDSVQTRMKQLFPEATGSLIVHRLDMATSGVMLIAKTKESHKNLQHQFINRTIKKRYVALLDGVLEKEEGTIELPLRGDIDDRPRQLVCFEHGKTAITKWQVTKLAEANRTKVYFFPLTGRTHQLRIHAAHTLGLNTAIVGDDLYGDKGSRLFLHSNFIKFRHPTTGQDVSFEVKEDF